MNAVQMKELQRELDNINAKITKLSNRLEKTEKGLNSYKARTDKKFYKLEN